MGNPATFNASITYTPGGSCDFKQEITRIKFLKINNESSRDLLLFSCSTNQGQACVINDDRLSLNRGNGLNFVFTLSNTHQSDSGVYEVVIEGTHPATSSLITIKKRFHLNIGPGKSIIQVIQVHKIQPAKYIWVPTPISVNHLVAYKHVH